MYQAEALWLNFEADSGDYEHPYPFAVKVATGKVSAITGEPWREALNQDPQDYLVVPEQPWLDGYCVERGIIRQFVAMPLGEGYTAEEQLTGTWEYGGLQLSVYPMKRDVFLRRFGKRPRVERIGCSRPALPAARCSRWVSRPGAGCARRSTTTPTAWPTGISVRAADASSTSPTP